jgi:hypothetical protein
VLAVVGWVAAAPLHILAGVIVGVVGTLAFQRVARR